MVTKFEALMASAAATLAAMTLLIRRLKAVASAILFIADLPAQHKANIAAIADNTAAIDALTKQVALLTIAQEPKASQ